MAANQGKSNAREPPPGATVAALDVSGAEGSVIAVERNPGRLSLTDDRWAEAFLLPHDNTVYDQIKPGHPPDLRGAVAVGWPDPRSGGILRRLSDDRQPSLTLFSS